MAEMRPENERLDSWKEIAAYLKRNERTVSRWEKRGMPVYRVPGAQRQAVFAYKHELDEWLRHGQSNSGPAEPEAVERRPVAEGEPPTAQERNGSRDQVAGRAGGRRKRALAGLGLCLLLLIGGAAGFLRYSQKSPAVRPFRLVKLTDDGRWKSGLLTDGAALYFDELISDAGTIMSLPIGGGQARAIETPFSNVDLLGISNDGRSLLVTSYEGIEKEHPLWIVPTQGGNPRRVGDAFCRFAQWSPDNRRIACISGTKIILLNSEGFAERIVESFSLRPSLLVWSPDGTRLRFALEDWAAGTTSVREMVVGKNDSDAPSPVSKLPFSQGCCIDWAWTSGGRSFLYLLGADNDGPSLFFRPESNWLQRWFARDSEVPMKIGKMEAFVPGRSDDSLYLLIDTALPGHSDRMEMLKLNVKQGTFEPWLPRLSATFVAFSPDGQWMAYVNSMDKALWRSRADGSGALQLTKPPLEVQVSAWSPDGGRIAFMAKRPGKPWRIFVVGRDGGFLEEAASGDDDQGGPSWSPDGRQLAYANVACEEAQACWVHRLDLETRKTEIVPDSHRFRTARWSPDGKYIAATQPDAHRLMLFDVGNERWTVLADSITGDDLAWSNDSAFVYADSPHTKKPTIDRVRIKDGQRFTAANLVSIWQTRGQTAAWFGLAPDNSLIVAHELNAREVYALQWTDH